MKLSTPTKPKFINGQEIKFTVTITATAIVDGVPEWDEEEQKYLYAVDNVVFSEDCKEDIFLTGCKVKAEEPCLLWEHEMAIESLPSCEFDPN